MRAVVSSLSRLRVGHASRVRRFYQHQDLFTAADHSINTSQSNSGEISSLEDRTEAFFRQQRSLDDSLVISLLQEWKNATTPVRNGSKADHDTTTATSLRADNRTHKVMKDIVHHWLTWNKYSRTSEPFLLLLQYYQIHEQDSAAMTALDVWGSTFGGDIELAPSLEAYHLVLRSAAVRARYERRPSPSMAIEYTHFSKELQIRDESFFAVILAHLENCHALGNYALKPTVETYAHTIHAYHKKKEILPLYLVDKLQMAFEEALQSNLTPDSAYYMISGYSKALASHPPPDVAERWCDQLRTNVKDTSALSLALKSENPDDRVASLFGRAFQSMLAILACEPPSLMTAGKAKALLDDLTAFDWEEFPFPEHYTLAIECCAHPPLAHDLDPIVRELLQQFEQQYLSTTKLLPLRLYALIIRYLIKIKLGEEAESVLDRVMALQAQSRMRYTYQGQFKDLHHDILESHFQDGKNENAVKLFERMDPSIEKDAGTYARVLKAISRLHYDAVWEARKVWEAMLANPTVVPVGTHFASLIATLSRSTSRSSAQFALEALDLLEECYKKSPTMDSLRPQPQHYTGVICAIVRCAPQEERFEKATAVFERMKEFCQPDTIAYSALLSAVASGNSEESARQAEDMLGEMELLSGLPEGNGMSPTRVTYTTVATAWAKSGRPDAPEMAEEMLERMESNYLMTGDVDCRPDQIAYGVLINCWSSSGRSDAGLNVDRLLLKLKAKEAETGEKFLNAVSYSSAMLAHFRANTASTLEKVQSLLMEMQDRVANGDIDCSPDTVTYTTVIQTISRGDDINKATKAHDILKRMIKEFENGNTSVKPNQHTFAAVLKACAQSYGKPWIREQALQVALEVMDEFRAKNYGPLSNKMYSSLLQVFGKQVKCQKTLQKYVEITFTQCCNDGLVDDHIIRWIRQKDPDLYSKLPRNNQNRLDIPRDWYMNVEPRFAQEILDRR